MIALRSFTRLMVRGVCLEKKNRYGQNLYILGVGVGVEIRELGAAVGKPIGSRESEPPENFSPPRFCFLQINFLQSDLSFMGNKTLLI